MAYPNHVSLNEKDFLAQHKNITERRFEKTPDVATATKADAHDQISCRLGDNSCAQAHAVKLQRTLQGKNTPSPKSLLHLQRNHGNQFVGQVLAVARKIDHEHDGVNRKITSQNILVQAQQHEEETGASSDVENGIDRSRGGGQALDANMHRQMSSAFNADFSGVRIHTSSEADSMNRSLSAKAFTTGKDIYFRQGEYNPGSSSGRELLAHELTHVVQQNPDTVQRGYIDDSPCGPGGSCAAGSTGVLQAKLTVGSPGDIYEQEADQMATSYSQWEHQGASRSESEGKIRRQAEEEKKEDEKPVMAKAENVSMLQRQPEAEQDEEEKVQTKLHTGELQRQGEEEQEQ
jgi:hypothetical protein